MSDTTLDRRSAVIRRANAHSVYRMFDSDGNLLYIGCTGMFESRMKHHRYTKSWWDDVASVTQEHYADHVTAYEAEAVAIVAERPRYNRAGVA